MKILSALVMGSIALGASSMALASETINYTYDAKGRLRIVQHSGSVNNGQQVIYTPDQADNRTNIQVTGAPTSSPNLVFVVPLLGGTTIVVPRP